MDRAIRDRARGVLGGIKKRCYDTNNESYPMYGGRGVTVCDEWLKRGVFLDWYCEHYYDIENEYMCVDKDIIGDGMCYSPENCIIVPTRINNLFVHKSNDDLRGLQLVGKRYQVKVRNPIQGGENQYCGTYDSMETASKVYNKCKEEIIKGVAEEYKAKLPFKIYDALVTFKFRG